MASPSRRFSTFLAELKRRNVYRVTAIYVVLAAASLELASVLLPSTRLPPWFDELFLGLAIVGLPLVLVLAWTFDITEAGVERTHAAEPGNGPAPAPDGGVGAASKESDRATAEVVELDPLVVAVLPFENLSGSEEAAPFALGLHDDLLTELSRASALTVISRTSVRGYLGSTKALPEIARELGAGTIVEGGVQKAGDRVRLNVQLIDAATDRHLWAERYDRELTAETIFELQSELARRVMAQLHATLTDEEAAAGGGGTTDDLEAYRLLMTARELLIDRSEAGFTRAAQLFEEAIARDPDYALAWAGLADALIGLVDYGHTPSRDALAKGADACRRALQLDPALAEGYAAWGRYRTAMRDSIGSAQAHAKAIALQPSYAGPHQWSCWANLLMNRGAEALRFGAKAVRLDPLDPEAAGNKAVAHLMVGEPALALEETGRILETHPRFEYAMWARGLSLQALGRWDEAAAVFDRLTDRWTLGWPELGRAAAQYQGGDTERLATAGADLSGPETGFERGMIRGHPGVLDGAFDLVREEWPFPWAESLYLYVHRGAPTANLAADPRFERLKTEVLASWMVGEPEPTP